MDTATDGKCVADAQAIVDHSKGPFVQEFPAPFDASSAAGKTFWIISITQAAPTTVAVTEGFQEAARAVGANAVVFDGKGSPDLFNQGVNTAVSRGAAGIVLQGFEPSLVKSAVANAEAQGIPVVHSLGGIPKAPNVPGVVSTSTFDAEREGILQAAYAAVETGCKVQGVMFYTQASAATDLIGKGAKAELERLCPETCSLDLQNVEASNFATELTPQTQNFLQRSPDVNFILTSSDSFVSYILAGAKSLGREIPVVGATGQTLEAAQGGSGQVADILWPPLRMCGYLMFDAALRATGGHADTPEFGLRLVDEENWGEDTSDENLYPELAGYQNKFKEIWGVAGA